MLEIRDMTVTKAGKTICRIPSLNVEPTDRVAMIGANGTGKTTLLRVVAGLEQDFSGHCETDVPIRDRVFVHQAPYLFRGSVLFNTTYGLAARKVARRSRNATARKWLDMFGVGTLAGRKSTNLSGGEQRRVALARAFATQAKILLLDEPFADLDQAGMDALRQAIAETRDSMILISSPTPLPDGYCCRTFCLEV